jgi:hypothetical protein
MFKEIYQILKFLIYFQIMFQKSFQSYWYNRILSLEIMSFIL